MMICMMMTASVVCGVAVDVFRYCRCFRLLLFHVHAVAGWAIAHDALDAPRDICAAMCMSCARLFVIMSCFVSITGSGNVSGSSSDNSVRIWDVSTHQQVAVLTGHTESVNAVAFDVSGKYLASGEITRSTCEVASGGCDVDGCGCCGVWVVGLWRRFQMMLMRLHWL